MLYCFDTCRVMIRTIPTLQHDPARPEDVLKGPTDHACDEVRYACLSRPWVRTVKAPEPPKDAYREHRDDMRDIQSSVKLL